MQTSQATGTTSSPPKIKSPFGLQYITRTEKSPQEHTGRGSDDPGRMQCHMRPDVGQEGKRHRLRHLPKQLGVEFKAKVRVRSRMVSLKGIGLQA